jgi:hypothetical protein
MSEIQCTRPVREEISENRLKQLKYIELSTRPKIFKSVRQGVSALSGVESRGPKAVSYVPAINRIFLFFLSGFVRFA